MNLQVVSVFDRAIGAYMRPMFVRSVGEGLRVFQDEFKRPDSEIGKHPEDYDLYWHGSFNDQDGSFELDPVPKLLLKASTLSSEVA